MTRSGESPVALWWEAARPRTLPAAIAPVVVACALAANDQVFRLAPALICLTFALLIQVGTNFANDYFDFKKGADNEDRVGPGRAVAAGLIAPMIMKRAMIGVFVLAFLIGLSLLPFGGWPLLVVGLTSIFCGVIYTGGPYPLAYHGWGDLFVFVFFGLVAVTATYFVQAETISLTAWWIGSAIGALSSNILVVNNYRDVETDRAACKRTLVVRLGRRFAQWQFGLAHGVSILVLIRLGSVDVIHWVSALVMVLISASMGLSQYRTLGASHTPAELIRLLGDTGRYLAIWSGLLAAALLV